MKTARRQPAAASHSEPPGLATRRIAADIVEGVLRRRRPLDEFFDGSRAHRALAKLDERDRAFVRALATTTIRRLGSLRHVLSLFLERGPPNKAPRAETALLLGAAQILFLNVPDHAAVDLSVRLVQQDRHARHYTGLVNAVLRRVVREGAGRLAAADVAVLDTPGWLMQRWTATYGAATAHAIAVANGHEAALDITVKADPEAWAARLDGQVLPTGSVRTIAGGLVTALPGFSEGAWWVQDAAAALPARLLGDIAGRRVADLCAAPGGKTAQLAAAGARVTAVDRAPARLDRLRDNLQRLSLEAELVCADVGEWQAEPFDAVLLDAPCSSTGTIRRHPDVPWLKQSADIDKLAEFQGRLLARAAALTKPGGALVYCTCSLEPEEGKDVVAGFLASEPSFRRAPLGGAEIPGIGGLIDNDGDLRTLPCHFNHADARFAGLDGFYATRLLKH